jgi:hypothetical protein
MARNVTTFESGNRAGSKLTPELAELFISTIKQTGRISVAAGRCCIAASTARHWMQKGRQENAEPIYKQFTDDVERSRAEFLAVAARRMSQLAIGGVLTLPKYDKLNQLVRDANNEIEWEERYFPPNVNALAHVLDRLDPEPNGAPTPGVPERPILSDEEKLAQTTAGFDLLVEAVHILTSLGVPLEQLLPPDATPAIETTATAAPAEPEPANVEANATDTSTPTEPSDKPPDAF